MSEATLLERIMGPHGLSVVFQPILQRHRSGWRLHAVEGLVRGPSGTNMEPADVLFEYVRRKHEETTVDRECIARILAAAVDLPGTPRISVNVHASTLGRDSSFLPFLEAALVRNGIQASRLIVEIVEHSPYWDGEHFIRVLDGLRGIGVHIALDDIGLGHSNHRMVLECRPEYFKVDRYLVKGANSDFYRRALLRSLTDLAGSFGAYAVAEGVDCHDDLGTVVAEGFTLVQGFLLSKPLPASVLRESDLFRDGELGLAPPDRALRRSAVAAQA